MRDSLRMVMIPSSCVIGFPTAAQREMHGCGRGVRAPAHILNRSLRHREPSTRVAHQSARAKAGRSVISRMRPAEILTTRQAESVPMLWSITLRIRTVKVAKIPRHQVRHDVAHASGGDLVAAGEAIKDQIHMVRSVAFPNESG